SVPAPGPATPGADVPQLFDRFYQSRQSVAPATGEGGKGLGLAIVKRIAELHGGDVAVRSSQGVGTTVTLSLPAAMPCRGPYQGVIRATQGSDAPQTRGKPLMPRTGGPPKVPVLAAG